MPNEALHFDTRNIRAQALSSYLTLGIFEQLAEAKTDRCFSQFSLSVSRVYCPRAGKQILRIFAPIRGYDERITMVTG